MKLIRRAAVVLAVTATVLGLHTPAHAAGWVANSCAVQQALWAHTGYAPYGQLYRWVPCGTGTSGVIKVHAGPRPFFINPEGPAAPFCFPAGRWYYPQASGAVLTPTVRC